MLDANDVNNDGLFSALDVLVIINELNSRSLADATTGALPRPEELPVWPGVYYDRTGDGLVAENDALRTFDELDELVRTGQVQSQSIAGATSPLISETLAAVSSVSFPASSALASVSVAEVESPITETFQIQASSFLNSTSSNESTYDERVGDESTDEAMAEEIDWRLS